MDNVFIGGDGEVGMFSMLAAVVERVIECVWGRLGAMGGWGCAGRGSELVEAKQAVAGYVE